MYLKKNWPEKDELTVCTVKTILPASVVVDLDEYEKKEGMVHISEISRKWVRSIKTYMKPGTKLVCKVMEAKPSENFITLSVRRVGAAQHRNKMAQWTEEKKANEILEVFAKQQNLTPKAIYEKVGNKILEKYVLLRVAFIKISQEGEKVLTDLQLDKSFAKQLAEFIQKRITLPKAEISGTLTLTSAASNGIEIIKESIDHIIGLAKKKKTNLEIKYLGAPKYKAILEASDFKTAEEVLKEVSSYLNEQLEAADGSAEFTREG